MKQETIKVNLTRDGFSAIETLVRRSRHFSKILNTKKGCVADDATFFWDWDLKTNKNIHQINLPVNKLSLLQFLFEVELEDKKVISSFGWENRDSAEKMIKRILKAIKKQLK